MMLSPGHSPTARAATRIAPVAQSTASPRRRSPRRGRGGGPIGADRSDRGQRGEAVQHRPDALRPGSAGRGRPARSSARRSTDRPSRRRRRRRCDRCCAARAELRGGEPSVASSHTRRRAGIGIIPTVPAHRPGTSPMVLRPMFSVPSEPWTSPRRQLARNPTPLPEPRSTSHRTAARQRIVGRRRRPDRRSARHRSAVDPHRLRASSPSPAASACWCTPGCGSCSSPAGRPGGAGRATPGPCSCSESSRSILNGGSFDLMTGPAAVILLLVGLMLALWQPRLAATSGSMAIRASSAPAQPAAPAPLAPQPPPPPSILGRATLGLALVVAAFGALVDQANGGRMHPEQWLGAAAVVCGLGLLVGTVRGRARWLVVPAAAFAGRRGTRRARRPSRHRPR